MKFELSGNFKFKIVTENILFGTAGSHYMHKSVKRTVRDTKYFREILWNICEKFDF